MKNISKIKTHLKIGGALIASFLLVFVVFGKTNSPNELSYSAGKLFYQNDIYRKIAGLEASKNSNTGEVLINLPVKYAEAKETQEVMYKGKKLTFLVETKKSFTQEELEFYYQLELLKEQQGK